MGDVSVQDNAPKRHQVVVRDPLEGISDADKQLFLNGKTHIGVSLGMVAAGAPSKLMIPDVTQVTSGQSPVFITKPVSIVGQNLTNFFKAKNITLNPTVQRLIGNTSVTLGAFYYKADVRQDDPEKKKAHATAVAEFGLAQDELNAADAATTATKKTALEGKKTALESALKAYEDNSKVTQPGILFMNLDVDFGKGLIGSLTGDPSLSELFEVTNVAVTVLKCSEGQVPVLKEYVKLLNAD